MKNFIPVMRAKRLLEMKGYLEKGYVIQDKKRYLMLEQVALSYMDETFKFSIQVTQDEIYFYINKNGANIYLSIAEIYELLYIISKVDRGYILGCLRKQLNQKKSLTTEFYSSGLPYKMMRPIDMWKIYYVDIPQTGIQVSNKELFILVLFIQEKSNALFRRSTGTRRSYVNGILRLLVVLLEGKEEDILLNKLGWEWDLARSKYVFVSKEKRVGRESFKYYLTRKEYNDKISVKKS